MGNSQGSWSRSNKVLENMILMGDSILDDFYSCNDHQNDVEHQLMKTFKNEKICITNLALDSTTTYDLLKGRKPDAKYVTARKEMGLSPYQIDPKDGKVHPLQILTRLISDETIIVPPSKDDLAEKSFSLSKSPKLNSSSSSNKNNDINDTNIGGLGTSGGKSPQSKMKKKDYKSLMRPIVVLSVGGNDLRNHLSYGQFDLIVAALDEYQFKQNFDKIVKFLVNNLKLDVILVLCCEPHESFFKHRLHFCRDDLTLLMEWYAKQMFKIAETYKLPVLDLSRTMNPFDQTHYGTIPTQPSNIAGQFIVDLIVHILGDFDFESVNRKAMIYYGNGRVECQVCDKTARSGYLRDLNKVMPSDGMGFTEMGLLDDLFAQPSDQKENDDSAVEPKQRKFSFLSKKPKSKENNSTNNSRHNSTANSPIDPIENKEASKHLDQIINEAPELTDDLKFFSKSYDKKTEEMNGYATQTRTRDRHSLFDTASDTVLKSYSGHESNNSNSNLASINEAEMKTGPNSKTDIITNASNTSITTESPKPHLIETETSEATDTNYSNEKYDDTPTNKIDNIENNECDDTNDGNDGNNGDNDIADMNANESNKETNADENENQDQKTGDDLSTNAATSADTTVDTVDTTADTTVDTTADTAVDTTVAPIVEAAVTTIAETTADGTVDTNVAMSPTRCRAQANDDDANTPRTSRRIAVAQMNTAVANTEDDNDKQDNNATDNCDNDSKDNNENNENKNKSENSENGGGNEEEIIANDNLVAQATRQRVGYKVDTEMS